MPASDHPPLTPRRVLAALALTGVGGFVDAFSYMVLSHVYTATMSGNTVLIAVDRAAGDTSSAILHAYTVGVFVVGLLLSAGAIELGLRRGVRRVLAVALAIEAACLAALAFWGAPLLASGAAGKAPQGALYLLLAFAALAMGTQNTSLRMAGVLTIFTTHVTGTLTRLGEQLVALVFAFADRRRGAQPLANAAQIGFSAGLWLAFLVGALAASEALPRWGIGASLAFPIAALALIAAIDLARPLAPARPRP
jgi:uncharacterized membrane protein YoaK (UPF0700 family)